MSDAFALLMDRPHGTYTVPVTHRDGHTLWAAASFNRVTDPDTGRQVTVGTFRDVTAEQYVVQRDNALATLSVRLSQAESLPGALAGACAALAELWQATRVYAAVFGASDTPTVIATGAEARWDSVPEPVRAALTGLRNLPPLTPGRSGVALEHPDGTLALWIDLAENRHFTEQDRTLLALLAGFLGQGLRRIHQMDQQRETALALQRAILGPAQLPDGFVVRYAPATRPLKVGGDWYDTVTLSGGRIGIVVGDCVGHGLEAATVMGQLRSACRALLLQNTDPAQTLTALDRFAEQLPGALCATVFCGVLDPATGDLAYSSAGHPPALVIDPGGATVLLDRGLARSLGVRSATDRPEARYNVPARATLLLYTDGLIERRRRPLTDGIGRAAVAVRDGRSQSLEDLATKVMDSMAPDSGFDDDVALLLYRHPGPLELDFPAESTRLAGVRTALRGWLARCGIDTATAQNVLVAVGEACANAIEHGHRHLPVGRIRLRAAATAGDLQLTIADTGRWQTPQPGADPHRGRGLMLMRALMTEVTVTTGAAGTIVDLQARIPR